MERMIRRFAAAALGLAATTVTFTRGASAQSSRSERAASASSSRSFDKVSDARDLTTGLTAGVYSLAATGVSISGPQIDGAFTTNLGEGLGLLAGYGFNRTLGLFASLDVAKQATSDGTSPSGTFGLAHFEIGARANISTGSARTIPYVSASIGNRALAASIVNDGEETNKLTISGHMFALGAGIQHFMSPHLALDAGVEYATGKLGHFDDDGGPYDMPVNSSATTRLRVGVNWRP
jgi:opacity protein-like surface antigen